MSLLWSRLSNLKIHKYLLKWNILSRTASAGIALQHDQSFDHYKSITRQCFNVHVFDGKSVNVDRIVMTLWVPVHGKELHHIWSRWWMSSIWFYPSLAKSPTKKNKDHFLWKVIFVKRRNNNKFHVLFSIMLTQLTNASLKETYHEVICKWWYHHFQRNREHENDVKNDAHSHVHQYRQMYNAQTAKIALNNNNPEMRPTYTCINLHQDYHRWQPWNDTKTQGIVMIQTCGSIPRDEQLTHTPTDVKNRGKQRHTHAIPRCLYG